MISWHRLRDMNVAKALGMGTSRMSCSKEGGKGQKDDGSCAADWLSLLRDANENESGTGPE